MGRRTGAVLVSLLLLLTLAVSASAAAVKMTVGVRFWRESGDKESMADSAVDTTREATLTRQPNGLHSRASGQAALFHEHDRLSHRHRHRRGEL